MVFNVKAEDKKLAYTVRQIMGSSLTDGQVGIEVEVEGNQFPKSEWDGEEGVDEHLIPSQWNYHQDGSLRGEDNAEYVLAQPLSFGESFKAVDSLWEMFSNYGSVLDLSNRTSVHVHLNAQTFYLDRLCCFCALYFTVEELLTSWCGDHRVGNLFCLQAKDAPAIVSELKKFLQADGNYGFSSGMHYAGLNISALQKFGSVEVRTMHGCTDPEELKTWVSILQRLYDLSGTFKDPRQVVEGFSGEGPMAYLERILGPYTHTVLSGAKMTHQQVVSSLYEGIRFAQDLCYCVKWDEYEKVPDQIDPFGRSTSSVMSSGYSVLFNTYAATPAFSLNIEDLDLDDYEPEPDYDDAF